MPGLCGVNDGTQRCVYARHALSAPFLCLVTQPRLAGTIFHAAFKLNNPPASASGTEIIVIHHHTQQNFELHFKISLFIWGCT